MDQELESATRQLVERANDFLFSMMEARPAATRMLLADELVVALRKTQTVLDERARHRGALLVK